MARKRKHPVTTFPVLTATEGKSLRFVVSRSGKGVYKKPVETSDLFVGMQWGDLPHSPFEATAVLRHLAKLKLVERKSKDVGYLATDLGFALIKQADAAGLWRD